MSDPAFADDATVTVTAPPDPAAADQPPVADPWAALAKDAAPLAYRQDGAAKTFDGILEVPGKGALLRVRFGNAGAKALYSRFGFQQVAVRPGYYPAHGGREDAIVMRIAL